MSHNTLVNQDICLFRKDEISNREEKEKALWCLVNICHTRPKNIIQELNMYRKHVPVLLKYMDDLVDMIKANEKQEARFYDESENRTYKRWTDEEEKILIDMVCDDNYKSAIEIATILGRTVPAIKTKISNLVGVKRISQKIAGRFIGQVNGENVDTNINGTLIKED